MHTVLFFCFTFDIAFEKQKLITGKNVNIHQNHCKPLCTIFIIYIHSAMQQHSNYISIPITLCDVQHEDTVIK